MRAARHARGLDIKPKADGPRKQAFVERIELQPIDPQTNGAQLLYGLRYHTHVTKPGQVKTYHDQVGYHHTDRNHLTRIAEPTPNPLAR